MRYKTYKIKPLSLNRYDELIEFWKANKGTYVGDDDKYERLKSYLKRNPKLSFMVLDKNKIIGTIKSGHDGRRGYLHHLAVDDKYRKQGIARELVKLCLEKMSKSGIHEFRAFVFDDNAEAASFWKRYGFKEQKYNYRTFEKNYS